MPLKLPLLLRDDSIRRGKIVAQAFAPSSCSLRRETVHLHDWPPKELSLKTGISAFSVIILFAVEA